LNGAKLSPYAKLLRTWKGFESNGGISDHVIRSLPRDYNIFRRMHPGDQYPEAHEHAMNLLHEEMAELEKEGTKIKPGSAAYHELRKRIVPPYDASKFPNK